MRTLKLDVVKFISSLNLLMNLLLCNKKMTHGAISDDDGGFRGVMVIVEENGYGDPSSNLERG